MVYVMSVTPACWCQASHIAQVCLKMAVISVKESRDSQDGHGSLTDPRGEIKRKIFAHSSVLLVFST